MPIYHPEDLQAKLVQEVPDVKVAIKQFPNREAYHEFRKTVLVELGKDADSHKTSPLTYTVDDDGKPQTYIGGYDAFSAYVKDKYGVSLQWIAKPVMVKARL